MSDHNDNLILRAAAFAAKAHEGVKRKYTGDPYIFHPGRVAMRVSLIPGATPEMVAAAWLHDVVEDTKITARELVNHFGIPVAGLVVELTNVYTAEKYPQFNRNTRKYYEAQRLKDVSNEAKLIKMLDRIDNIRESDPEDPFFEEVLKETRSLYSIALGPDVYPEIAAELKREAFGE